MKKIKTSKLIRLALMSSIMKFSMAILHSDSNSSATNYNSNYYGQPEEIINYDTINLKKDYHIYDSCFKN
jgi:hypothetical protein